ncbi:shikimate dehydrogenase [Histidinibacterium lentulum]|uniref:Shikimate dehydrogenase (NADP(+)) n=1 Tax=Histidinibacterium lentulum TaxID=2480588 RepID=A0A3N2R6N8_9RHOB|nr:shikimate dehydrogenase [Histidinibacterium lentulum]ROU03162.1 shikimate dehydrogenase [Histidinibacterium lentulum]
MSETGIPLAGVIGHPIAHSRSPQLHGHWLSRYGLRGHYVPMNVAPDDLAEVLRALPRAGFAGVNVTIPHKRAALALADEVTESARRIGAANTLTFADGRIHADNTDGYGFLENLRQGAPGWDPAAGAATVLGAGGAARAVIVALMDAGVSEVQLTNRTRATAEALRAELGGPIRVRDWMQAGDALRDAALVVNTTSLGMTGGGPFLVPLDGLSADALVTDLVYTPLETPLLRGARDRGCRTVDGLGMLLHQGVPGFERWFGRRPEVDDATRAAVLA